MMTVQLGTLFVIFKVLSYGFAEESPCTPGFESKLLVFRVHKDHLHRGERLGRVIFNTCDGRTGIDFQSTDQGIDLNMDGTLMMRRSVTLHEGLKEFSVSAWDSSGKKHTASVRVERVRYHEHHDVNALMNTSSVKMESSSDDLVLTFPKSSSLKRAKRGWIIPPISVLENRRGPFPMRLVQIKSDYATETRMVYKITGEGADLEPKGIFQIDKLSGWVSVTQQLDRENKAFYKLVAHANGVDVNILEKPMEIIITVIDQNDNKPVFTQNPFNGNVPEAAKNGEVFMTVTATDADDKENTENADISYAIISQDPPSPKPNMFAINPVSGGISVLETGLDRKQWSSYTLVISAADLKGEGLSTTGTAVITVTDSNDSTLQFKRGWIIPPINVAENSNGPFPMRLVQIRSDFASESQMTYEITGEGADLEPKGIFLIDRVSGWVSVTQKLDRETKTSYKLVAHATGVDVNIVEKPLDIVVNVMDQNDNKPVFTQSLFSGSVPEALGKGEVFMTVTATDADDKENTDNADISYAIISQDPPSPKPSMFAINPVSGGISVLETGLDRKQWSRYTLVITATDMNGEGLSTTATAVITVTDPAI